MPVLCKPAVAVPEHVITQSETLALASRLHADHPQLPLVLQLIENVGVAKRHLIRPIDDTLRHTGFTHRNQVFETEAKKRLVPVMHDALGLAGVGVEDIRMIVLVSCTGFMMPSLTAWLINEMGFGLTLPSSRLRNWGVPPGPRPSTAPTTSVRPIPATMPWS